MITNPHDALFKGVFGQPEHARGTLREIVPAALGDALDWPSLRLQPGSFVDPVLNERHTDLLYSVTWRTAGAEPAYLLFEHQSTPPAQDPMALRMLRYQLRTWERWRGDQPKARALPMILPIVLYHGATPWPEPRSFEGLLDVPASVLPAARPHVVCFRYLLHDLSTISDDELRAGTTRTALAKLVAMSFKHAGAARLSSRSCAGGWTWCARWPARRTDWTRWSR
ncbi:MAG TPA: Rpn family recombination-promoting nuclease/putative transposase [Kofleriaceae bacterium]|nr:Rpn family recombination-promoting nuclease/putative transposase [Kofleriaceae bacterium]